MILNVSKPIGMTSHDVVDKIRRTTGEKRVGHAGTLDPFASGVLVVGVSREDTKKLGDICQQTEKEYVATLELGKISTTGDPTGVIENISTPQKIAAITGEQIEHAFQMFTGEITQTSPAYSAVKVHGTRAYKLAREGKRLQMPKRIVSIYNLEMLQFNPPFLKLKVICSFGTYIRVLAQDIGEQLGVGAYLTQLTRTRVGDYRIENSKTLDKLKSLLQN